MRINPIFLLDIKGGVKKLPFYTPFSVSGIMNYISFLIKSSYVSL